MVELECCCVHVSNKPHACVFAAAVLRLEARDAQELNRFWALKHGCAAVGRETVEVTVEVPPTSETIDVIASRISESVSPMSLSGLSSPASPGGWAGGGSYMGRGRGSGLSGDFGTAGLGTISGMSGSIKPAFVNTIRVSDSANLSIIRMLCNYKQPSLR